MIPIFGIHLWKSMKEVEDWVEVEKGIKIKIVRWETPKEYHKRPYDKITICFFSRCRTFNIPRLIQKIFKKGVCKNDQ